MPLQPAIPIDRKYTRVTLNFGDTKKSWTESHWLKTVQTDLSNALQVAGNLGAARAGLLPKGVKLRNVRISQENVYRDALTTDIPSRVPPFNGTSGGDNLAQDCLVVLMQSGSLYRRSWFMGGIPDEMISAGAYNPNGITGWDDASYRYFVNLTVNNPPWGDAVGFLANNKDQTVCPDCDIASVSTVLNDTTTTITTVQPHLLQPNDVVRIRNYPKASAVYPLNQLFRVKTTTATTFTVDLPNPATAAVTLSGGGKATKKIKTFVQYTDYAYAYTSTRKRGNRSGLSLGRSKRKRTVGY